MKYGGVLMNIFCGSEQRSMTKREAAITLVDMLGTLQSNCWFDDDDKCRMHEAVAIACAELMIDEVLDARSKAEEVD